MVVRKSQREEQLTSFLVLLRKKIIECIVRTIRAIVEPISKRVRLVCESADSRR